MVQKTIQEVLLQRVLWHCNAKDPGVYRLSATAVEDTKDGHLMFFKRGGKILGIAHTDTVKWNKPKATKSKVNVSPMHYNIHNCPQLDDRLGVAILLDILPLLGIQCDVFLTDNEECGRTTAKHIPKEMGADYNWMFSFDRRGDDVVLYDYDHAPLWKAAVKGSFDDVGIGSFSCICRADHLGICGINVGCGYHQQHTDGCHMLMEETCWMLKQFLGFYKKYKDQKFEWKEDFKPKWKGYANTPYWQNSGYSYNSATQNGLQVIQDEYGCYFLCPQCGCVCMTEDEECYSCGFNYGKEYGMVPSESRYEGPSKYGHSGYDCMY